MGQGDRAVIFGVRLTFEDGDYYVSVRDLPEVVTAGSTVAEALELAADAISAVLEHREEQGLAVVVSPVEAGEYEVKL